MGLLLVVLIAREQPSLAALTAFSRLMAWDTTQLLSLEYGLPGSEKCRGGKLLPVAASASSLAPFVMSDGFKWS